MNWTAKYVVFDSGDCFVFNEAINHKEMLKVGRGKPIGAGKCHFEPSAGYEVNVVCYGESVSLDIKSREIEDAKVIGKYMLQYNSR